MSGGHAKADRRGGVAPQWVGHVDDCVKYHVTLTSDPDFKDDPRRFVLDKPSSIDLAHTRVMDPMLGPNAVGNKA